LTQDWLETTNAISLYDFVFVGGDGTNPAQSAIPIRILFPPTWLMGEVNFRANETFMYITK